MGFSSLNPLSSSREVSISALKLSIPFMGFSSLNQENSFTPPPLFNITFNSLYGIFLFEPYKEWIGEVSGLSSLSIPFMGFSSLNLTKNGLEK